MALEKGSLSGSATLLNRLSRFVHTRWVHAVTGLMMEDPHPAPFHCEIVGGRKPALRHLFVTQDGKEGPLVQNLRMMADDVLTFPPTLEDVLPTPQNLITTDNRPPARMNADTGHILCPKVAHPCEIPPVESGIEGIICKLDNGRIRVHVIDFT